MKSQSRNNDVSMLDKLGTDILLAGRILTLCLLPVFVFAQDKNVIQQLTDPNGWIIRTKSSAYQLSISSGKRVTPVFYGPVQQADYNKKNAAWNDRVEEIPVRGAYPFKTPAVEVIYNDNVRDADLEYVNGEVIEVEGRSTLKIVQKDRNYPLQIISYIRVLEEFDILEKWMEVSNTGKKGDITVEKLLSANIVLPTDEYVLTQLSGKELHEFQQYESLLTPGIKIIENKAFKSNFNAPWFLVRPKTSANEENGPAWFGSLHYSGNWQLIFDKTFNAGLQILGGINFWDTELNLKPGDFFQTPKLSVGFVEQGAEGAARNISDYVRKTILPAAHRNDMRPVLFNSWYATTYHLNEEQQLGMAKIAADLGVELFVIDDGWYKGREGSTKGLGDWEVDKKKFPNGLSSLIKGVNDLGMKFGIWVEPECVNLNSDVYRAHPDWILKFPGRRETPYRVFLNLAKEEVYNYLLTSLSKLLSENKIDFIKWDQNTYLADVGWPDAPVSIQKEVRLRFINNLYRLIDELKKRFPNVWLESCASGGGRVDLGMLSRMDQAWTSDNTTAVDRLFIQYGYLGALPANTMVSWVIEKIANQVHQETSLSYKFDVAMSGVLGIGYDIRKWTKDEQAIAKKKIEVYKNIRPVVQQGILYRLVSPFENNRCALQYNSADRDSSVIFCYNMAEYLPGSQLINRESALLKLKGLDPDKKYILQRPGDEKDKGSIYRGDFLMNIGIEWPVKNSFQSGILIVTKEL